MYSDFAMTCLDNDFKSRPHKTELERLRTHDTSAVVSKEVLRRCDVFMNKGVYFKALADSIEWELKKY